MSDECKVYVRGISESTTESDLRDFFAKAGTVTQVFLRQSATGPYAFVGFENMDAVEEALLLDAKDFQGAPITVQKKQQPRKCFRCGQTTHISSKCPETDRVCFRCNRPGHISRDCPGEKRYRDDSPRGRDDRSYRRREDDRDYRRRDDDRDYRRRDDDRDYRRRDDDRDYRRRDDDRDYRRREDSRDSRSYRRRDDDRDDRDYRRREDDRDDRRRSPPRRSPPRRSPPRRASPPRDRATH